MGPAPADAAPERPQRPVVTIIRCARPPARDAGAGAGLPAAPARPRGRRKGGGVTRRPPPSSSPGSPPSPNPLPAGSCTPSRRHGAARGTDARRRRTPPRLARDPPASDYGGPTGGPKGAVLKGAVLRAEREAQVVDVQHEVPHDFPVEASFWLGATWAEFPRGTVHLCVADPGRGQERDIVAVEHEGHFFLAYDNGVLEPVLGQRPASAWRMDPSILRQRGLDTGTTFQDKDLLAPLAALLAAGRARPRDLGTQVAEIIPAVYEMPALAEDRQSIAGGRVVSVDSHGNLLTNLLESHLARLHAPAIEAGGIRFALKPRSSYGGVAPGTPIGLINAFGFLELARAEQSLAATSALSRGAPVSVTGAQPASPPVLAGASLDVEALRRGPSFDRPTRPTFSPERAHGRKAAGRDAATAAAGDGEGGGASVLPRIDTADIAKMVTSHAIAVGGASGAVREE